MGIIPTEKFLNMKIYSIPLTAAFEYKVIIAKYLLNISRFTWYPVTIKASSICYFVILIWIKNNFDLTWINGSHSDVNNNGTYV